MKSADTAEKCIEVKSLPVRGAWIEITISDHILILFPVAPRAGSVD